MTQLERLSDQLARRNRQIRWLRRGLLQIMEHIDGAVESRPPLPAQLRKWAKKEISKL